MATFSNQASLTYNGTTTNSNVVYGEILEVLTATKTAVEGTYTPGGLVTYVVSLRNTGTTTLTGLTVTDDLGGYTFGPGTVYPLTHVTDTVRLLIDGVVQAKPTVTAGPPMVISGVTIPADTDAVLVYQARVNSYANPETGGTIVNTVTADGAGLASAVTATETVAAQSAASLTITKSMSPTQVADNGQITYTFVIQNSGNEAVDAADNATITDTFDPILTGISATLNGGAFTDYTYSETTGAFATTPGAITVPAATVTQDVTTGEYTVTPGIVTVTVTGTI